MINFQFFPRSHGVTPEIQAVIDCFKKIEVTLADGQHRVSNDVLALLRPHLEACGYDVEKGKGRDEKIDVPVLFGENNEIDGNEGLSRAFKIAGVDNIMMTLWNVSDNATSKFMELYYISLMERKNPRAA